MPQPSGSRLPAPLLSQWVHGPLLYNRWLLSTLDAQTALWREMERQTASLMQLWLDPATPPPSAQSLVDAAQGIAPLGPAVWLRAGSAWFQIWADALRHDATEA